ncbi:MAG: hypothetical protein WBA19_11425, partial [Psychroserpens sp.]
IFVEAAGMKMQISAGKMGGQQVKNPTEQMSEYDLSKIKKTGKTKTILGATCYEYIMTDKDVTAQYWAAPSIQLPNWFGQDTGVFEGYIMAFSMDSKDGNMTSEVIEIKENISKVIDAADYKKMF